MSPRSELNTGCLWFISTNKQYSLFNPQHSLYNVSMWVVIKVGFCSIYVTTLTMMVSHRQKLKLV